MKIHVLGSGAYPLSCTEPLSTCLLLPEHGVMIDAGLGISRLPKTYHTDTLTILLTHFHHDHILGLAFLANVLEQGQAKRIQICGDERIEKLGIFFQEPFNPEYTSEQMPITFGLMGTSLTLGALTVTRQQVPHASGLSNMFRITDSRSSIGFLTDTTASPAHGEFMRGAHVVFMECTYDNASKERAIAEGHSYPEAILTCLQVAQPAQAIIIHADPRYPHRTQELQKGWPTIGFAHDGDTFTC